MSDTDNHVWPKYAFTQRPAKLNLSTNIGGAILQVDPSRHGMQNPSSRGSGSLNSWGNKSSVSSCLFKERSAPRSSQVFDGFILIFYCQKWPAICSFCLTSFSEKTLPRRFPMYVQTIEGRLKSSRSGSFDTRQSSNEIHPLFCTNFASGLVMGTSHTSTARSSTKKLSGK